MGLKTFKGGVHPYEGKELAKDQPIKEVRPGKELVYPVSQHIGAPANPIVAVGDTVLRGQMIAEAGGFVSSPIFSSVSGTVKAIEPRRVAVGDMVKCIVIENNDEYKEVEYKGVDDVFKLSNEEIIAIVRDAGVVGTYLFLGFLAQAFKIIFSTLCKISGFCFLTLGIFSFICLSAISTALSPLKGRDPDSIS